MTAVKQRAINIINMMPEKEVEKFILLNIRYEQSEKDTEKRVEIADSGQGTKYDLDYVRSQGGTLHHLADLSKVPYEEGAWQKAAVEKYRRKMEEMHETA